MQLGVASALNMAGMVSGAIGIFFGFYFLSTDLSLALRVVTCFSVGVVGFLAFVRHVVFHRSDAIRLGWQTNNPAWQMEVGFANLAVSAPALYTATMHPSNAAFFVLLTAYSLYLAQATVLHAITLFRNQSQRTISVWTRVIATGLFALMLGIFAGQGLHD